ncbi:MAG: hypothetical protein J7M40_18010 [Planctomycetes bacterium]|nr:hypothetical protein [Planctomycetota bacterium]
MAKNKKIAQKHNLPGTIYFNNNRYWWIVKLPGETKRKARPLKSVGSQFAATDVGVAVEIARNLLETAIFDSGSRDHNACDSEIHTIAALSRAFLQYAEEYYRSADGTVTEEPLNVRYSLKPLIELFATLELTEFGPLKLIEVRNKMISLNWSRGLINQRIGRIKRMFKWAVSRQIVSPLVYQGLMSIEGLKQGRSGARETAPIMPVDEKYVYAILPYTTPVIASMLELLLFTGMRPGELVIMRPCDIDRSSEIWHYKPASHKTQYKGKDVVLQLELDIS